MNPLIQFKKATPLFLITGTLLCFGLLPVAQAVVPAPDGGYPGGNTAEGQSALLSRTTGGFNTAVGLLSLRALTTGSFNTAVGAGTLLANNGAQNTATGVGALFSNTTGHENTGVGAFALFSNTTAAGNSAFGQSALRSTTTGSGNTASGEAALFNNSSGSVNTADGDAALLSNTTGIGNTASGANALQNNTAGNGNIGLGVSAGDNVTTANNVIVIGANVAGANVSDSCYIGQIFGAIIDPATATPVGVDSTGKLGTVVSSRRFKRDIKPMDDASKAILALKPVSFHYKSDAKSTPCFGLIAEEVAAINPDLVVRDKNGEPLSVRYDQVNAMLLNEFLKEHRKVEEQQGTIGQLKSNAAKQEATISELKKDMGVLTAQLKEQASLIEKVSAQLEGSKPAPQVVNNP